MMTVDCYPHNPRNNQDQGARDPAFSRETNLNIEHFQGDQPEDRIIHQHHNIRHHRLCRHHVDHFESKLSAVVVHPTGVH